MFYSADAQAASRHLKRSQMGSIGDFCAPRVHHVNIVFTVFISTRAVIGQDWLGNGWEPARKKTNNTSPNHSQ